jgi:hypothetical protein
MRNKKIKTTHLLNPSHNKKHVNFNISFFLCLECDYTNTFFFSIFFDIFFYLGIQGLKHEKNKT